MAGSEFQPAEQSVNDRFAVLFVNCLGQRDTHRAGLHTILSIATVSDAVGTHNALETLITSHFPRWMHVEKANLGDRLWSNVVVTLILRTCFETAATRHTSRIGITFLHFLLRHARAWTQIMRAVEFNPCMHASEMIE